MTTILMCGAQLNICASLYQERIRSIAFKTEFDAWRES